MKNIYLGSTPLKVNHDEIKGEFIEIENEHYYKISNYDLMPDFFMTIVSNSDHWMFISSNGSLSMGRKDRDNALFPYYTDDKIHDYCGITGCKTLFLIEKLETTYLWEPFSKELSSVYKIQRNLYKSEFGNKLIFEEINMELGVTFQYGWYNSEKFGFIKKSKLSNLSDKSIKAHLVDGITNILPAGVDYDFQNEYSNLLDGYKKNELIKETDLGLFMLSSIPVDKAEPSESLNATTVWATGLDNKNVLLSDKQIQHFKNGVSLNTENNIKACRGSYLLNASLELEPEQIHEWLIVAEINQSTTDVANLNHFISNNSQLSTMINDDIDQGTEALVKIVAASDGLQITNEKLSTTRHFSNTLFNIMRGGTYIDAYVVDVADFIEFVDHINQKVGHQFSSTFSALPGKVTSQHLLEMATSNGDKDLIRICREYLPLTFSRRHGDPSRPWNLFSIENRNEDGSVKSDFQGNWRDIFQNWEALCLSYPEYIENIISKFVNASTADGYNPYRIMRDGIDWECPDENDPWAYIGYWGDHQIIYLQKLLELSENYNPGKIDELLEQDIFAYANVPYRIKSYSDTIKDPHNTIEFNYKLNEQIKIGVKQKGADARLLMQDNDHVYHVNLTEKILVSLLVKLSNFIPEGGIWLNTQRPEWNDANNALVGNGASMVTLYYLFRFVKFWNKKFISFNQESIYISEEVVIFFNKIFTIFTDNQSILTEGFSDQQRRQIVDSLGTAGSDYRETLYNNQCFSGQKVMVKTENLTAFTALTLRFIEQSISVNKREDGLYHAYNLIEFNNDSLSVRYLYEMLEGQVAVLSSGFLSVDESHQVLDSLKNSSLFRSDQYSYLLYPNRELPLFHNKNNIPENRVKESKLLSQLCKSKDPTIINIDNNGDHHFKGTFRNAEILKNALKALDAEQYEVTEHEISKVLDSYEEIFDHQSYTGRSGTFYAYEGLGSIYWHMVSKLLLAVEECYFRAVDENADPVIIGQMKDHYYEIKAGIGLHKTPKIYGAFPTDAYSHTPDNSGVKQPGMTGQVKEDVISRMGCLGVRVHQGQITFDPRLLNHNELLEQESTFKYSSLNHEVEKIELRPGQLGFTVCQVPVVYSLSDHNKIVLTFSDNSKEETSGNTISKQHSSAIFKRNNEIQFIEVSIT